MAGVQKGGEKELGRETSRVLSRLKHPFTKLPFPSLSNACHAGYFRLPMSNRIDTKNAATLIYYLAGR